MVNAELPVHGTYDHGGARPRGATQVVVLDDWRAHVDDAGHVHERAFPILDERMRRAQHGAGAAGRLDRHLVLLRAIEIRRHRLALGRDEGQVPFPTSIPVGLDHHRVHRNVRHRLLNG